MVSRINTLKTDLKHYVKHFRGRIDKNLCDTLVREMDTMQFKQHTFYDVEKKKICPQKWFKRTIGKLG